MPAGRYWTRKENMKDQHPELPQEPEWAAYVAIDWADQKHVWKLQPAGQGAAEGGELEQTPEAIETWASRLQTRYGGRPIAVALEQSRGAVVCALSKYSHLHLYPVHPSTLAHFRQALVPSGCKNDPGDTGLLLELLMHHRSRLRRLRPDTEQTRELQFLVEVRRKLVDDNTCFTNRLTAQLKIYFPQVLQWFYKPGSPVACDFLTRWATLEAAQKASSRVLRDFFRRHNCQDADFRIQQIRQALPATADQAVIRSSVLMVQATLRLIGDLRSYISRCEDRIEELSRSHPDFAVFDSLPGAGDALVPRLIAAFGTQRERFSSASEVQAHTGIAPVVRQSGNTRSIHCRKAYPHFLRQTFHEWAAHSIQQSQWAREYYDLQLSRGKKHHAAVRALAYKWIRIVFRCWQDGVPYSEPIHTASLKRRRQAPSPDQPPPINLEWKKVAGFSRISRSSA